MQRAAGRRAAARACTERTEGVTLRHVVQEGRGGLEQDSRRPWRRQKTDHGSRGGVKKILKEKEEDSRCRRRSLVSHEIDAGRLNSKDEKLGEGHGVLNHCEENVREIESWLRSGGWRSSWPAAMRSQSA